jgi:SAM-dependent methyltransferase
MDSQRSGNRPDWQTLRELYDRRAERYRSASERAPRMLSRKHQGIISCLNFAPVSRVLDAGCGDGVYCEWLTQQGVFVVGVDISPRILALARSNVAIRGNAAAARFGAGNLERLPLASESFDAAICIQVVEHLLDARAGLAELHRVLRHGGRLVISTDNRNNIVTRSLSLPVRVLRRLLRLRNWEPPFPHRDFRVAEFAALISEAGFRIEWTETFRFSLTSSLSRIRLLTALLDWIEAKLIHLPYIRDWGDIIVVIAHKASLRRR